MSISSQTVHLKRDEALEREEAILADVLNGSLREGTGEGRKEEHQQCCYNATTNAITRSPDSLCSLPFFSSVSVLADV